MTGERPTEETEEEEVWVRLYSPEGDDLEQRYKWRSPRLFVPIFPPYAVERWIQETPESKLVLFKDPMVDRRWNKIPRSEFIAAWFKEEEIVRRPPAGQSGV